MTGFTLVTKMLAMTNQQDANERGQVATEQDKPNNSCELVEADNTRNQTAQHNTKKRTAQQELNKTEPSPTNVAADPLDKQIFDSKTHCTITMPPGSKEGDRFLVQWPGKEDMMVGIRVPAGCVGGTTVVIVAPAIETRKATSNARSPHVASQSKRGLIDRVTDESNADRSPGELLEECAFWDTLWPNLAGLGWNKMDEAEETKLATYFIPPLSDRKPTSNGDRQKRKKDMKFVIKHVKSRGASGDTVYQDCYNAYLKGMNKNRVIYSRWSKNQGRKKRAYAALCEGKNDVYKKHPSRVGPKYQVSHFPEVKQAGEFAEHWKEYDQLYDPSKAEGNGDLESFFDELPHGKKETAFLTVHKNGYNAVVSKHKVELTKLPVWTDMDKKRFHETIIENRKNFHAVSKQIGKSVCQCLTYYFGCYKQSDDYNKLKEHMHRVPSKISKLCAVCSLEGDTISCDFCEKAFHLECLDNPDHDDSSEFWYCTPCQRKRKELGYDLNLDFCNTCGVGGSLLCCDGCDNAFHLECLTPPLKDIPSEDWFCVFCIAKKAKISKDQKE